LIEASFYFLVLLAGSFINHWLVFTLPLSPHAGIRQRLLSSDDDLLSWPICPTAFLNSNLAVSLFTVCCAFSVTGTQCGHESAVFTLCCRCINN
jgi:hypothetical protein